MKLNKMFLNLEQHSSITYVTNAAIKNSVELTTHTESIFETCESIIFNPTLNATFERKTSTRIILEKFTLVKTIPFFVEK